MKLHFIRLLCLSGIVWFAGVPARVFADPVLPGRRIAVVVGANAAPPGRRELRFALDDARQMADALQRVGRFDVGDVHVLLEPNARAVLDALDGVATQVDPTADRLLVFYYSGHSDGRALYPRGEPLPLADVREHLLRIGARVRVGILDTCRGGSWTQAKDLSVGPALPEAEIAALATEGTVLVAASSGFENAHEAEALHGSFFTHHLIAGLLGAADNSGDGKITVQEAFEYARERTVRDSARYAPLPQHPSFEIDLRGRQDVVLAQISASRSALELVQTQGPFEVIHLASGATLAELPSGARRVRLALAPGRYLVRRVTPGQIYSKEVAVAAGGVTSVAESQLEAADTSTLAMKGGDALPAPMSISSSLPAHWWELRLAAGVDTGPASQSGSAMYDPHSKSISTLKRSFSLSGGVSYAFTDRLTWSLPLPAFSYRIGEEGEFEVIPRMGLVGAGYSSGDGLLGVADAGVSARLWTLMHQSLIANLSGHTTFSIHTGDSQPASQVNTWGLHADAGYGMTIHNVVSLYPGVGFQRQIQVNATGSSGNALQFGSVLMLGYRSLPLVQVHLTPQFSLDAYATWAVVLGSGALSDSYLAGFTLNL